MPLTNLSFDTPKSSSLEAVHVTGTIDANNAGGYVRITVNVTRTNPARDDVYYVTATFGAKATATKFHGTYNLAISPRATASNTVTISHNFSYYNLKANE